MKKFLLAIAITIFSIIHCYSQGCSPLRHISGVSPDVLFKDHKTTNKFVINLTNRYFEASNTYRGTKEQVN